MDVLTEQRKLNSTVYDVTKKLRFKNYKLNLAGSARLQSMQYFSDYDFNSIISRSHKPVVIYNEFRKILMNDDMYFIELKIEYNNGSKIKIHDVSKLRKASFKDIYYVKIDYVLWHDYHFKELSIMYIFKQTKYTVDDIKKDYDELVKEGNYYKAVKRLFSISRMTKNRTEGVKLTKFFNSTKLYEINSNLKAIQLMTQYYNTKDVQKKIAINLKFLKIDKDINIDEVIESNDKILNDGAQKYLI